MEDFINTTVSDHQLPKNLPTRDAVGFILSFKDQLSGDIMKRQPRDLSGKWHILVLTRVCLQVEK